MTLDECKSLLFKLGVKYGVSPRLISEKLLSKDDKLDMLGSLIDAQVVETAVKAWRTTGSRITLNSRKVSFLVDRCHGTVYLQT